MLFGIMRWHHDSYRMLQQRYQPCAVALQPAGDFEFQQLGSHDRGRGAQQPHQIVERNRRRSEQGDNAATLVLARFGVERAGRFPRGLLRRQVEV
jgi:hypothetical protein